MFRNILYNQFYMDTQLKLYDTHESSVIRALTMEEFSWCENSLINIWNPYLLHIKNHHLTYCNIIFYCTNLSHQNMIFVFKGKEVPIFNNDNPYFLSWCNIAEDNWYGQGIESDNNSRHIHGLTIRNNLDWTHEKNVSTNEKWHTY